MWHTEYDYMGAGASQLIIKRVYNSNPLDRNGDQAYLLGAHWSSQGDMGIKNLEWDPATGYGSTTCWQWSDNGDIDCSFPHLWTFSPNNPVPPAVQITRSDGKKYVFHGSGNNWFPEADVRDRMKALSIDPNVGVTAWDYIVGTTNDTEHYDGGGNLLGITTHTGLNTYYTYSDGTTNDTSVARYPANAPVCSHVQAGAVLRKGALLCVTDNWGRQVNYEYDVKGRVAKTIDPAGQQMLYAYDGPSGGCDGNVNNTACAANNLTSITYPDGSTKTYYYNEASRINGGQACPNVNAVGNGFGHLTNGLTGIVDENGNRYLSWSYSCNGLATVSEVAQGIEKVQLAYGSDGSTINGTTIVTHTVGNPANPQTTTRAFLYNGMFGVFRNTTVDGPCVECGPYQSRTYDGNANTAGTVDWKGNLTCYAYDLTRNLETARVEGLPSSADCPTMLSASAASLPAPARKITTQWHATYSLPTQITEPGKVTAFTYDNRGNLLTKTETDTASNKSRTSTYTYNNVGQLLTATDPNGGITTYTYDNASGNLLSIKTPAGLVTTLSNYDPNGRVGRITDPNGIVTDLAYSPRGWLTQRTVTDSGVMETTGYTYDNAGQLTQVSLPDGSRVSYTYDAAHRLTDISDSAGDTLHYTLDLTGNRIQEQAKDPNGNLARQITRVYDTLNRLQQVTGGAQ